MSKVLIKKRRFANIELLRICAIIGVLFMHFNGYIGNGLDFAAQNNGMLSNIMIWFNLVFSVAVNVFILIMGYFMIDSENRSWWKPLKLVFETILIGLIFYLAGAVKNGNFSVQTMIAQMIPQNYFVILYIVVYVLSYYLNKLLNNMSVASCIKLLIILLAIFSIWTTAIDLADAIFKTSYSSSGFCPTGINGSGNGYTIINFLLIYIIGAALHKIENLNERDNNASVLQKKIYKFNNLSAPKLLIVMFCITILQFLWVKYCGSHGYVSSVSNYNNPFIIINTVIIFLVFQKIRISDESKPAKIINTLAKGVFGIYLIHPYILSKVHAEQLIDGNTVLSLIKIIFAILIVYSVSYLLYEVLSWFCNKLYKYMENKFGKLPINYL